MTAHATQAGKGIGRIRFKDLNDDGMINDLDKDWLGTLIPKLIYGLSGDVYKNFSLSMAIRGVYGVLVQDRAKPEFGLSGRRVNGSNKYSSLLDAWTPEKSRF
ncbi:MAG: hypothetical protein MZV63_57615 [Marinilabiliales bacterium]|nr:hypothetical protein [Marinilabiliales bacterium]